MTRLLVNVVKGEREGKNDLTRHFFTTNVKLRRLMRVRISHEMASRKMLKFSSLALNQIFDEFFFRRRREFLQIWKLRHGGPNSCVCVWESFFLVYNNKYIACEIFSELSIFSQKKNKSKAWGNESTLAIEIQFQNWHGILTSIYISKFKFYFCQTTRCICRELNF